MAHYLPKCILSDNFPFLSLISSMRLRIACRELTSIQLSRTKIIMRDLSSYFHYGTDIIQCNEVQMLFQCIAMLSWLFFFPRHIYFHSWCLLFLNMLLLLLFVTLLLLACEKITKNADSFDWGSEAYGLICLYIIHAYSIHTYLTFIIFFDKCLFWPQSHPLLDALCNNGMQNIFIQ